MQKFKQLSLAQRYRIEVLLQTGFTQTEVSKQIGVNKSTISRELKRSVPKRGKGAGSYCATNAQRKTDIRHKTKPKHTVFDENLKERARHLLRMEKYSPELIAAYWKKQDVKGVSHETIYKWIWESKHSKHRKYKEDQLLYRELKHGKRRRKRGNYKDSRGAIKDRVPITERPEVVQSRKRIGDIEVDLMIGRDHKSALLVLTDRALLLTALEKIESKDANVVAEAITKRLCMVSSSWIKTLTYDNGKEFAMHKKVSDKTGAKSFFTRPYTSQDKGTVENRIGVVRRFFPKKTDLRNISDEEIKRVERSINQRPIRKFGYLSPIEVLKSKCVAFMG
ncbi:MAG: IS30 family transposase [Candidatus Paceibacterota bacterium]